MKEDIKELQKLSILVDADEEGYLLQIFTNLLKTDQHYSLKSFKEWVQKVLVPEILKHFLKVLKENKL
jgi:hypothetical protein